MNEHDDRRLIEDYLPIEAISREASREKSVRKGHISTLHLWWARRPLVACRAAVYGALAPASQFVPANGPDNKKQSLGRANAAKFVTELCKYPGNPRVIQQAQEHILEAHAQRLTAELAEAAKTGAWPAWVDEFQWPKEKTTVTRADIEAGRAPRPRVLDMFAGGGSIPLEALRLGCEAYAMDLNPVAYIIELCTLVYPQKYGKPDPSVPGMTGPKGKDGKPTWGGLANEVRYWGNWVLERVRREIGDLYPPIPDPTVWDTPPEIAFDRATGQWNVVKPGKPKRGVRLEDLPQAQPKARPLVSKDEADDEEDDDGGCGAQTAPLPPGFLQPVAYLWTRTVRCKNPACGATVPLVRQTWLCKKKGRYVALKMLTPRGSKSVRFEVVESDTEKALGFDPAAFSKAGNATCPFCGAVADNSYVKQEGRAGRMATQPMAIVCTRPGHKGKVYLSVEQAAGLLEKASTGQRPAPLKAPLSACPSEEHIRRRIDELCQRTGLTVPNEPIEQRMTGGICLPYGLTDFGKLFTPRQMLCLLSFTAAVREAYQHMLGQAGSTGFQPGQTQPGKAVPPEHLDRAKAVVTYLGVLVDRLADMSSTICRWLNTLEAIASGFGRQALPMVWDFVEAAPFGHASGGAHNALGWILAVLHDSDWSLLVAQVVRGSATALPRPSGTAFQPVQFDAVITDPPYYDNVDYAKLADFFYVWLKRTIGDLYPEHFATQGTPKKQEAVADPTRHGGDKAKAVKAYEAMMAQSLAEANRVLKPGGTLVVVYAHKTTLGWATLVDALRKAGFTITEAWPLDTERKARLIAMDTASLASSIFLVGRKREGSTGGPPVPPVLPAVGSYEQQVQPELAQIVRERVETLWQQGVTGADLVIACVGAGLRAFTKYERVEYANGEEVPAEKFLAEVEGVVLDAMLAKLLPRGTGCQPVSAVSAIDPPSRFYVLWRFIYKAAEIDAGEAIVFTYSQHVELDGPLGLSGRRPEPLLEKKKAKYRARDFTERGENPKLGLPDAQAGTPVPLIDVLHRVLWLMENSPGKLSEFLDEARPDRERLRVLAQALAGAALSGKRDEDAQKLVTTTAPEQAALQKLLANWRNLIEGRTAASDLPLFDKKK